MKKLVVRYGLSFVVFKFSLVFFIVFLFLSNFGGKRTIPLDHIVTLVKGLSPTLMTYYGLIVILFRSWVSVL